MKKILLAAINAKYSHTGLGVRSVCQYAKQNGISCISFMEFTTNQPVGTILNKLYSCKADVIVFSCYIWNIEIVRQLASELKSICPQIVLVAAGPQVRYDSPAFVMDNPAFSVVIIGEGEKSSLNFFQLVESGEDYTYCKGLTVNSNSTIVENLLEESVDMNQIPFCYDDLHLLNSRAIYYESMRGCPFSCSYCMSSMDKGARTRSLQLVFADLQRFLDAKVIRVKFVDRTFNAVKTHAMAVWEFLIANDNCISNFHFELAGHLLDGDMLALLSTARAGLFQFEIGVQSTNEDTLSEIDRPGDTAHLFEMVVQLKKLHGIHLHLDLIAGLPFENFQQFAQSFNDVYFLSPDKLQLGFLKVLAGSKIHANVDEYGIVYSSKAPFEILQTKWLSFEQLMTLHGVEHMLDSYYNSGRFDNTIGEICGQFKTPFEFYKSLWHFFVASGHDITPLSKIGYYNLLGDFMRHCNLSITHRLQWLCKYDMLLHEKIRVLPNWVNVDLSAQYKSQIRQMDYSQKNTQLEFFPFSPITGEQTLCALLFDYANRDVNGKANVTNII